MKLRAIAVAIVLFGAPVGALAHVGSPDIYVDGNAGPYKLSVIIRPPVVIPGVAEVAIRAEDAGIEGITIVPLPVSGEAAKHPPTADAMVRSAGDTAFFTGNVWIMVAGSWQIRLVVHGPQGDGTLSIPFPAMATATRKMPTGLGILLSVLAFVLVAGAVGIIGAAIREAHLAPRETPSTSLRRRGRLGMVFAVVTVVVCLVGGGKWWRSDAANHGRMIYKPLQMDSAIDGGSRLNLRIHDPGWLAERRSDDFIPDHGHLMHLYMIRWPEMDVVFHLHPELGSTGDFSLGLPNLPAGNYHLYADVVHADGFAETLTSAIATSGVAGRPLAGDDARGDSKPVGAQPPQASENEETFRLADGYAMVWERQAKLAAAKPEEFKFKLLDPQGRPPSDMALYMGMAGHAAFVKTDGTVFAHIHPNGTISMATFMMTNPDMKMEDDGGRSMASMQNMPGMDMGSGVQKNSVEFPYGLPSAGKYRIFVQMKHGNTVETGVFDATADSN